MTERKQLALVHAFVALQSFHKHAMSPTQRKWALEAAANCLWGMGIEEYDGIKAEQPKGAIIDMSAEPLMIELKGD